MASRIQQLYLGVRYKLAFSNCIELLWSRIAGRHKTVLHYEWKNRWHLYADPQAGDHGSIEEVLADGVYDKYIRESCSGDSFSYVNVGANVGAFDVAVFSQDKVIPYALTAELNPHTFISLAFNISANRMSAVRLCNGGIAGQSGTMRFVARKTSVNDCIFADEPAPGADFTEVSLFTLEQALANAGLSDKSFDLLKLDAEGAEFDIIEASSPELLRRFAHIVMEIHHPPPNRSPEKLYGKLERSGFQGCDPTWTPADGHALRFWKRVD